MKLPKPINSVKNIILMTIVLSVFLVLGSTATSQAANLHANNKAVCSAPDKSSASCHARVVTDQGGKPISNTTPKGYGPIQFRTAYNLPTASANPATIAIVDAYNHPSIKSDLDTYDKTYGLPAFPNCSTSITTSCFMKVNQTGGTKYPTTNAGWALEIALDVEVAHAVCPNCKLILVEANSNSYTDLMTAVDMARSLGATVISNSYGSSEFAGETAFDSHFNVPGVAFVFSSGDNGYGATYPAASQYVTAVGGTTLNLKGDNTRSSETVWSGAGSGCSVYEAKPAFQSGYQGCNNRIVADVSADADPSTGAAVYDSVRYSGKSGWFQVGGTSLAAPIISGIYGLAGYIPASAYANSIPYAAISYNSNLFDVTTGTNGTCSPLYLCGGVVGFDGPSGLGSPIGLGAF